MTEKAPKQKEETTLNNPNTSPTLAERMYAMMCELDFIEKNDKNTQQGYTYANDFAIKTSVQKQLVKHRVLFNLSFINFDFNKEANTIYGIFQYTFSNVDNPEEKVVGNWVSSGDERSKKGPFIAATNAIKYILTSQFLIPTGDDAERQDDTPNVVDNFVAANKGIKPPVRVTPPVKTPVEEAAEAVFPPKQELVKRQATVGANAGREYWGLSGISGAQGFHSWVDENPEGEMSLRSII